MKRSNIVGSVILLLFSFAAYHEATKFPLGTDAFPKAVLIVIMILSAIQLILAFKPSHAVQQASSTEVINVKKMVAMGALLLFYIIGIQIIGYFIITPLFLIGSMYLLGRRDIKTILIVTASVVFIIYLVFRVFIYVPVPLGPFFKP
jgi:hypothetical protein